MWATHFNAPICIMCCKFPRVGVCLICSNLVKGCQLFEHAYTQQRHSWIWINLTWINWLERLMQTCIYWYSILSILLMRQLPIMSSRGGSIAYHLCLLTYGGKISNIQKIDQNNQQTNKLFDYNCGGVVNRRLHKNIFIYMLYYYTKDIYTHIVYIQINNKYFITS